MDNAVIITGAAGGIGQALVERFRGSYHVIAIDKSPGDHMQFDLAALDEESARLELRSLVEADLEQAGAKLNCLINNAAVQLLGSSSDISVDDFQTTLFINLTAPFILSQLFLPELGANSGSIVNIGSIHATLTKPGFVSYATSKAGLAGLTRSMAVDLQGAVRVNCIEPAAISTPMLEAGFADNPEGFDMLRSFHPGSRIGEPIEVASLAMFLSSEAAGFLNGACVGLNGAIGARLHDPT